MHERQKGFDSPSKSNFSYSTSVESKQTFLIIKKNNWLHCYTACITLILRPNSQDVKHRLHGAAFIRWMRLQTFYSPLTKIMNSDRLFHSAEKFKISVANRWLDDDGCVRVHVHCPVFFLRWPKKLTQPNGNEIFTLLEIVKNHPITWNI